MRIGLNLLYLIPHVVGGTETHAKGLLPGLAAQNQASEFFVFLNRHARDWPLPEAPNFTRVVCPVEGTGQGARYWFEQVHLPRLLQRYRIDVVHSLGYVTPLRTPCPSVVTVHDLNYRAFGQSMPWLKRWALRVFVKQSLLRATRVVTVSEFSRQEIAGAYHLPLDRIVVAHNGLKDTITERVSASEISTVGGRIGIRQPYIIAFSSTTPNKNISRLIQAFSLARARHALPHQLVLVGHRHRSGTSGTLGAALDPDAVRFTGYLDEYDLCRVLAGAQMLAFPSLYEGFGLPVLEAMAQGVPVVCSNQASLPEVAGEAAVFFDPYSIEDLAEKLTRVALDPSLRATIIAKGCENIARFSWERAAQIVSRVYADVANDQS